jgi:predicted transport protein
MKNPSDMAAAMSASMKERTGRTLEEWVKLVHASGVDPLDQNAVRRWLKIEHGVLQNSQWTIADAAAREAGWVEPTVEEYINSQYDGPKAPLRPIFDRLRSVIDDLGDDVEPAGRSTYTPFVRRRQFVAIAAATRSRVDVGLRYTDPPPSSLLVPANAPGQATHKVSLVSVDEVTSEVEDLIRIAYDQNG